MPLSRSCVLGARQCSQTSLCRGCPPQGDCCCCARPAASQLCAGSAQEQYLPPQWCAAASSSAAAAPAHTPRLTLLPARALNAGIRLPASPGLYCASWRAYYGCCLPAGPPTSRHSANQGLARANTCSKLAHMQQSGCCRAMWALGVPTTTTAMELLLKQDRCCSCTQVAHLQTVVLIRMRIVAVQPVLVPNLHGKHSEAKTTPDPSKGLETPSAEQRTGFCASC